MASNDYNPDLDAAQTYYNWGIPLPPPTASTTVVEGSTSTVVVSINGASGPSIEITGGSTGLTFSNGNPTISMSGTLVAANGGTGISSYSQGDLIYASATTTLAKLAKDANATRYLSNTGSSNNPAWAQINLTNGVTGVLPVANGGLKTNSANTAPTVNDDSGDGYSINSLWTDTTGPTTYVCQDATVGAAVWTQIAP